MLLSHESSLFASSSHTSNSLPANDVSKLDKATIRPDKPWPFIKAPVYSGGKDAVNSI